MPRVSIDNVGSIGVIKDRSDHTLPPEAWTDAVNIRFQDNKAIKFSGHAAIFDPPTVAPAFIIGVPSASTFYFIYTSLLKAYVYEGGTHTDITPVSDFTTANGFDWNGTILGGIPIINNGVEDPQTWDLNVANATVDLANWPASTSCKVMRAFGNYLVALHLTESGATSPHKVLWSHPADPGSVPISWDVSDPVFDAGSFELTDVDAGNIVDGRQLGSVFLIYKEGSTHVMRFVGGQSIFKPFVLLDTTGILAPGCVATIGKLRSHFVMTGEDLIMLSEAGPQSVVDKRIRKFLQNDVDPTNFETSFCFDNPQQREAFFCYPNQGSDVPNMAVVWNYIESTVQIREFEGNAAARGRVLGTASGTWEDAAETWEEDTEPWHSSSGFGRQTVIADANSTKIYELDSGITFDGDAITTSLVRTGLGIIGKDRQGRPRVDFGKRKLVKRLWPKASGAAFTVEVGAKENRDDAVTWQPPVNFNPATDNYVDVCAAGREISIRYTNVECLDGYDLEVEPLGDL